MRRAIITKSDGYTIRYEPEEDGWHWKVIMTMPPDAPGGRERTIILDPESTTADVLYQVSLAVLGHDPDKDKRDPLY